MGKYKFSLSDMIPNAWFYKLKDLNGKRSKNNSSQSQSQSQPQKPHFSHPLYFFHGDNSDSRKLHGFQNSPFGHKSSITPFPEPPRKSWRRRSRRKTIYRPSPRVDVIPVSAACSCHMSLSSVGTMADPICCSDSSFERSPTDEVHECSPSEDEGTITDSSDSYDDVGVGSWSSSCKCTLRSSNNDIIIDMNNEWVGRRVDKQRIRELDQLPPLSRKPMMLDQKASETANSRSKSKEIKANQSIHIRIVKEEDVRIAEKPKTSIGVRKSSAGPMGVKLRANSPRIARRKIQAHTRRNEPSNARLKSKSSCLSESFAMIKASRNPQEDFRESMVEMIVENNIRTSKDLEDLLACYLILNSDEYHDLIIKTFEKIWFDVAELRI